MDFNFFYLFFIFFSNSFLMLLLFEVFEGSVWGVGCGWLRRRIAVPTYFSLQLMVYDFCCIFLYLCTDAYLFLFTFPPCCRVFFFTSLIPVFLPPFNQQPFGSFFSFFSLSLSSLASSLATNSVPLCLHPFPSLSSLSSSSPLLSYK